MSPASVLVFSFGDLFSATGAQKGITMSFYWDRIDRNSDARVRKQTLLVPPWVFIQSDFGRGLASCSHRFDWCFVGEVTNREYFGFPAVPRTIAFGVHGFQDTPHGNHRRVHWALHIKTHRPPPSPVLRDANRRGAVEESPGLAAPCPGPPVSPADRHGDRRGGDHQRPGLTGRARPLCWRPMAFGQEGAPWPMPRGGGHRCWVVLRCLIMRTITKRKVRNQHRKKIPKKNLNNHCRNILHIPFRLHKIPVRYFGFAIWAL